MIDPTMPPVNKFAVIDKKGSIKLITSNKKIATWYQVMFNRDLIKEIKLFSKHKP